MTASSSPHKITIALLTRNRPHYLCQAIDSILAQKDVDLELLILDNASTDETPNLVRQYMSRDARVFDLRSEENIGLLRNWNRGIDLAVERSPFACIFHDDDVMLPGFLAESTRALAAHPSAAFSFCVPQFISQDGELLEVLDPNDVAEGLTTGIDFLELAVNRRSCGIFPPCVMFRSQALEQVGPIDSSHGIPTMDMNLYYRLARIGDVFFIRRVLAHSRQHQTSETDRVVSGPGKMVQYGLAAELVDVVGYLLQSPRAAHAAYRDWLTERLGSLHAEQSEEIRNLAPHAFLLWDTRLAMLVDQIERVIPPSESLILIDDDQLALGGRVAGRCAVPLMEQDGQYWGVPRDAAHAIAELERHRAGGVRWLVVCWASMWYLEVYADLRKHLHDRYAQRSRSPHGVIFELTPDS